LDMIAEGCRAARPGRTEFGKVRGLPHYLSITICSLGLCLMIPSVLAQDTTAPSSNGQSPDSGSADADSASQASIVAQVEAAVYANPGRAAVIVTRTLEADQTASVAFAGQVVSASIRGLGSKAKRVAVGRIILAAVKARPSAVLEIIRVSIRQSKRDIQQEIVAAAMSGVAAVGDPDMAINVIVLPDGALGFEPSYSTSAGVAVEIVDGLQFVQGASLAEQIVQVAFQSGSQLSLAALTRSANSVLQRQSTVPDPLANLGQLPTNTSSLLPAAAPRSILSAPTVTSTPPPPDDVTPVGAPPPVSP
jgi:hypothetical protein